MTASSPDDVLARVASDRATVYAALSTGFYLPDEGLVWDLREGGFAHGIRAAVAWLGPDAAAYEPDLEDLHAISHALGSQQVDEVLRDLRVEHARLFTGPGRPDVPIFESEYVDPGDGVAGRLDGPSTVRVRRWYRSAGLERATSHRDLPDHVATELEFLHLLARREAEARQEGRIQDAHQLRRDTDRFLREHPAKWMPAFCRATLAAHPHPFYGALAGLLAIHLATELGENLERARFPWQSEPRPGRP